MLVSVTRIEIDGVRFDHVAEFIEKELRSSRVTPPAHLTRSSQHNHTQLSVRVAPDRNIRGTREPVENRIAFETLVVLQQVAVFVERDSRSCWQQPLTDTVIRCQVCVEHS